MPTFDPKFKFYHGDGIIRRTVAGSFVAEFNRDHKRRRKTFDTPEAAKEWLEVMGAARRDEGKVVMELSSTQAHDALRALDLLTERGVSTSLFACAEYFTDHHRTDQDAAGRMVKEWLDAYIAYLETPDDGSSPARQRTVNGKKNRLKQFIDEYGGMTAGQITSDHIGAYLAATGAKGRNLLNYKTEIQSLFNFIERRTKGTCRNTVARFPQRRRKETAPASIMTPSNASKFLHAVESTHPLVAVSMALGCFGGLRTSEIVSAYGEGLRWEHIDFDEGEINVPAAIAKGRRRREVPITPNLMKWLLKYRLGVDGEVRSDQIAPPHSTFDRHKKRASTKTGISWVPNGARHSFGTYYGKLHGYRNAAEAMGHSGGMQVFEDHYKGPNVKKAEAERYFKIMPSTKGKVVQMEGAA